MLRAILLLLVALAGCRGVDAPAARHTLVVAYGLDEFTLTLNRERIGRYPLNAGVCEPLLLLDADFMVQPGLARSWTVRDDGSARLILRSGIVFSDGTALDGRAVAHTLGAAARTRTDYSFLTDSSVRIVDDTTVDVYPGRPNRRLIEQLVHPTYGILAPGSSGARPVCTGPYELVEYAANERLVVARNARFRGPAARMDTIDFRFIPDETTRALSLRAGNVDAIFDVGRVTAAALEQVPDLQVVTAPLGAVIVMYMNLNGDPPYDQLRDPALRRAIAMSIDRQTLVDRVLGGPGRAAVVPTVNPPSVLGRYVDRVQGVSFDTARARQLLGGRSRRLKLIANPASIDRATVEYVQAQLARVGIAVDVEQLDAAAFESRLNSGAFDLDLELPNQNDANPAFLLALRWYSRSSTRSAAYTHASARYDSLVERAMEARDEDAARRAAADAMHQLIDVEVGAIPLAGIARLYAMSRRVQGFLPHPSRLNQDWSTVWLAR
jgi:peptide/nickel transport system substrate-binding protein